MTLIELVVGLAIVVLVVGAVGTMFVAGVRSYQARHTGSMVQADLRFALDYVVRELRAASAVTLNNPSDISYTSSAGSHRIYLIGAEIMRLRGTELSSLTGHVQALVFTEQSDIITITIISVTTVDNIVGSGLPLTLTTRVVRRN